MMGDSISLLACFFLSAVAKGTKLTCLICYINRLIPMSSAYFELAVQLGVSIFLTRSGTEFPHCSRCRWYVPPNPRLGYCTSFKKRLGYCISGPYVWKSELKGRLHFGLGF